MPKCFFLMASFLSSSNLDPSLVSLMSSLISSKSSATPTSLIMVEMEVSTLGLCCATPFYISSSVKGDCPSFSLSLIRIMSTVLILVLVIRFIFKKKGVLGIISSLSFLVFVRLGFLLALSSSMLVALLRDGRVVDQKASKTKGSNP